MIAVIDIGDGVFSLNFNDDNDNDNDNCLNSMELCPSLEAASRSATEELPISWNLNVQYRVRKSLPLVRILIQINPVHTAPSSFFKIHFNVILPPTSVFLVHRPPSIRPLPPHIAYQQSSARKADS
jgi:hypothetical protein